MKKKLIKTIKVSIVGEPNVGKSTLLNKIFKKKISIVTRKSQTTIKQKSDVFTFENKQFIFLDTPGIFGGKERISRSTFKQASNAILESDLVLLLVNAVKPNINKTIEILKYIKSLDKQYLIVINKIDLLKKKSYLTEIDFIEKELNTNTLITLSAMKSIGINSLLKYLITNYRFYYKKILSSKNKVIEPDFIEEIVREKVLNNVHDEIPYYLKFKADSITKNKDKSYRVDLSIFYSKSSHKPIILGKEGKNIKKISTSARLDLERIYKKKFHLFLYLKALKKNRVKIDNVEK